MRLHAQPFNANQMRLSFEWRQLGREDESNNNKNRLNNNKFIDPNPKYRIQLKPATADGGKYSLILNENPTGNDILSAFRSFFFRCCCSLLRFNTIFFYVHFIPFTFIHVMCIYGISIIFSSAE